MDIYDQQLDLQRNLISVTRKIIDSIRDGLEFEEIFGSVARGVRELIRYSHLYLSIVDHHKRNLKVLFSNGREPNLLSATTTIPLSRESAAHTPFLEQYPMIVNDVSAKSETERIFREFFSKGIHSAVVIPLITKDHLLGNLILGHESTHFYSGRELEILQPIADQLAVAVERAILFSNERQQQERLRLINQTGKILLSSLDLSTILTKIGTFVQKRFSYYHLSIWLLNGTRDKLTLTAHSGGYTSALPLGYQLPLTLGIVGHVTRTRNPYYSPHIQQEENYIPLERVDLHSELCVPILFRDEILGVINLESNCVDAFSHDDMTLMQTIADQLAAAIINTRLFQQVSDFNKKLQEEIGQKTRELEHAKTLLMQRKVTLEAENEKLKKLLAQNGDETDFIGNSPKVKNLLALIERVAPSDATILIEGESGTGKELVARLVHGRSLRSAQPFVAINCGTLNPQLLESELFGHERGAFSGADKTKDGLVETARGGTLFLDEITELEPSIQSKLSRFIQDREYHRVGGKEVRVADVRIVCATNKSLHDEAKLGKFREDLYYRLNTITIDLPPLRDRKEDIPLLTQYFFERYRGGKTFSLSRDLIDALEHYNWPGNVREFEGLIQRLCILCDPGEIGVDYVPKHVLGQNGKANGTPLVPSGQTIREVERMLIAETLKASNGRKETAAKALGISLKTLYNKIHRYQIET
ncbi:MAG: sigma 54-interacting transcriptional regulator [Myxococcales bacterium]|nr:sigma 54-interacting transcriptional regulator [Myxococcales bacterium]